MRIKFRPKGTPRNQKTHVDWRHLLQRKQNRNVEADFEMGAGAKVSVKGYFNAIELELPFTGRASVIVRQVAY